MRECSPTALVRASRPGQPCGDVSLRRRSSRWFRKPRGAAQRCRVALMTCAPGQPVSSWATGSKALGVCRACCLAAPPGCRSRHENAAWSLTVRYGDVKTTREKCGVSGEKKAGRVGRRDSSVASRKRRRLAAKPGGGVERRPESDANAGQRRGRGGRAAAGGRRERGGRARGNRGERGEQAPLRLAECRFHGVFRVFSEARSSKWPQLTIPYILRYNRGGLAHVSVDSLVVVKW